MIGLDTNVLVRYIMQDDARQSARATELIDSLTPESPGFVPLVSLVELSWVMSSCFGLRREQVSQAFSVLLRSTQLVVDQAVQVLHALGSYRTGNADFADCLIARTASAAGCGHTVTFDIAAARTAGMHLLD